MIVNKSGELLSRRIQPGVDAVGGLLDGFKCHIADRLVQELAANQGKIFGIVAVDPA